MALKGRIKTLTGEKDKFTVVMVTLTLASFILVVIGFGMVDKLWDQSVVGAWVGGGIFFAMAGGLIWLISAQGKQSSKAEQEASSVESELQRLHARIHEKRSQVDELLERTSKWK